MEGRVVWIPVSIIRMVALALTRAAGIARWIYRHRAVVHQALALHPAGDHAHPRASRFSVRRFEFDLTDRGATR
jgi:fatty-acid desaturase